ncbi:MBL fold metallo-hydrolase [Draconibacterium sp.]|jgi:L-ascorbate metabolism protein UlaG (beta-lactamase superfamily)
MKLKRIMIIVITVVAILAGVVFIFLNQPKFGKLPTGERLEKIKKSPNYKNGSFTNLNYTPQMTGEGGFMKIMKEMYNAKNRRPVDPIPSIKTDLLNLAKDKDIIVWFGHSSYFMQIDGKSFLVDPVFCGNASPFSFMIKSFKGTDIYTPDDIPAIDYLIITHDHWDHLDYKTITELKPKIGKVITGLGTGAHLESWGYDPKIIIEKDWYEHFDLEERVTIDVMPARHFSGRGTKPTQTLWASFVLQTPSMRIFIGGDGGYDEHFAEIGKKYGGFDLAILENGQYNTSWKYIHMMPEQVLQAATDLNAKRLFPVHSSKFALANHSWDTPLKAITEKNKSVNQTLVTPIIGEMVNLRDSAQEFSEWWVGLK